MELIIILLYCCFSFILFLILNSFYKNNSDEHNDIFEIIFSLIYIVVLSGIFSTISFREFNENVFLIITFELIIRIYYINYILKQDVFVNEMFNIKKYIIVIFFGYLINKNFINKLDSVLPTPEDIRLIIWLLIFYFFVNWFKNNYSGKNKDKKISKNIQKSEYFIISYAKLKNKYHNVVICKNKELIDIIYSIMIYENYKRPLFFRKFDIVKARFNNTRIKYGIMQIVSKEALTDEESIEASIKKLEKIYLKLSSDKKIEKDKIIDNLLCNYYKKDICYKEVLSIYDDIKSFNK